ncbi:uncharacterized protein LOC129322306 [Prosopis cineraria]|uniref:uncharacterized protein LOC129322306 n=1 Tax=Prosopis cineraria TaxID=364024 RepID=UPI0024103CE3|nr:uncharacterized protein LOC129322306 [Prosopis cineraria]XP_054824538.1 uncharacterized protein LOC129322306 [Prosopis cineraria]
MGMLNLIISYDGKWDLNNRYIDDSYLEVLVEDTTFYLDVMEIVYKKLQLNASHEIKLMVSFDIETSTYSILEVKNDNDLIWYFNLLRNSNLFNFSLIVSIFNGPFSMQEVFEPCHEGESSLTSCSSTFSNNKNCSGPAELLQMDDIKEGDAFFSKLEVQKVLQLLAMKRNFEYKTLKSNGQRLVVACSVDGCKWYVRASTISSTQVWVIRQHVKDHTCAVDVVRSDHKQATSLIISECVKQKVINGECNDPKSIIKHMCKEFGVGVSYYKSWRAKELVLEAIQGCPEDSYAQLPSLCYALSHTSPGTVTDIDDGGNGRFKYFFVSFAASIEGWSHCRPIISIDGTFLRNKYVGTLLIACTMDGNNSIFPLAFTVVDSETDASWEWFLYKLKSALCYCQDLVFVSDRKSSIPKAVCNVFSNATHCICV